jgi:hypothetical protein
LERVGASNKALLTAPIEVQKYYLERHPERINETPSWLANTLWCYGLVEGKPTQYQVAAALGELAHDREEAA